MSIVIIALIAATLALWQEMNRLKRRVLALEAGETRIVALPPVAEWTPPAVEPAPITPPIPVWIDPVEDVPAENAPARPRASFEDIFGRRLPIWAGGVTLAVAGFLIVKYSIDTGLLSPAVRVVMGLIFGTALIAGAEIARRAETMVRDVRVPQSLAGAGIATLYAGVLVAANLYHLVGPVAAFIGMAAITALAGGLALRFGAPSALLGLVGGLAAPALVGSQTPDVPVLAAYLALAVGGLCALSRHQRWMWLGVAALVGGFGWGLALILGGMVDGAASLSIGVYALVLAVALPLLAFGGERGWIIRFAGGLAGCAQMAALVAVGGFAPLDWALFGLISIAAIWLSRREDALADLPLAGLGIALVLTLAWGQPDTMMLTIVLAGIATIYGGAAIWRLWSANGRIADAVQIAAVALATLVVPFLQYSTVIADTQFAALSMLGAVLAGIAATLGWTNEDRTRDIRFTLLASVGALLVVAAIGFALPGWTIAPAASLAAAGLLLLGERPGDPRLDRSAWGFGLLAVLVLLVRALSGDAIQHAVGTQAASDGITGAVAWLVPAAVAVLLAVRTSDRQNIAQPVVVLLGYVGLAQLLPLAMLPLIPATMLAAIGLADRQGRALPALAAAAALATGWALLPLTTWLAASGGALLGDPMLVTTLPSLADTATRIAAPALAIGLLRGVPAPARITGALLATIAAHIAYKQVFAIDGMASFIRLGMAERTLWEALLAIAAVAAWRLRKPAAAHALAAASFAHVAWFTMVVHDPLWSLQAVGGWPVANLIVPAYGIAFALLRWAGRSPLPPLAERLRGVAQMATILLFAATMLRQVAHGSMPSVGDVGQAEDIARSILAIGLAIGFLQWGIARSSRDWRIASLVLMLGAVGKVFAFDAAGLDGLMRIGSFAALGFSLIGIGWLYSRYIPDAR